MPSELFWTDLIGWVASMHLEPRPRQYAKVLAPDARQAHGTWCRQHVENFQEKCQGPRSGRTVCASLRSHVTRAILCENLQQKCRGPRAGCRVVRACAGEMHTDMSQEPLCARISSKMLPAKLTRQTLSEPWTSHKNRFRREFAGKKPENTKRTLI